MVDHRVRWRHRGEITFIGQLYRGYNISPTGSVVGLVWAFTDGAVGAVFAWLYDILATRDSPKGA